MFSFLYTATTSYIIAYVLITTSEAQIGPTDITRIEGQTNEFIPCPYGDENTAASWRINNTFYHHTRLPCPFIVASNGILIPVLDRSISGTSFQCFATSSDGQLLSSSVGVLTVLPDPSSELSY